MEKRKSITVWYSHISIAIVIGSFSFLTTGFKHVDTDLTTQDSLLTLIYRLHDQDLNEVSIKDLEENTIYLFNSDKSCIPCYKDVEQYIHQNFKNYSVNIILIMEENILVVDQQMASIDQFYKEKKDFFFLFYPTEYNRKNKIIPIFNNTPSPFLYEVDNNKAVSFYPLESIVR